MLQPKSNGKMPPVTKRPMVPTRPGIETPNNPSSEIMRLKELERVRLEKQKEKNRQQATKGKMKMGGTKKYQDGGVSKAKGPASKGAQMKHDGAMMKKRGQEMKAKGMAMKKIGSDMKPKTAMDGLNALAFNIKNMGVYKKGGMVKKTMTSKKKSC